jgi:radical SAM/Cys-rich protein
MPSAAEIDGVLPFHAALVKHGLELKRARTETLQVNVGLTCNQTCRHCHLEAGPHRTELMTRETMGLVADFAEKARFQVIDITGGAPELNPDLLYLLNEAVKAAPRVMLRSNLTILAERPADEIVSACVDLGVVIVGSFPSTNLRQSETQRGAGSFEKSVEALRMLNRAGYGRLDTGLELNLVGNPAGAFLPPNSKEAEDRFRRELMEKWGVEFSNLFTFANVPLGRFKHWLVASGNYESYLKKLAGQFNPCTVQGLMCRSLISVSWDGFLYDCDFNLAAGMPAGWNRTHVSEVDFPPSPGAAIAVSDHCYACAAGPGFT